MGDVREGNTVTHAENAAITSLELSKLAFFQACASCLLVKASSKSKHVHLISVWLKYADLQFHLKAFSFVTPVYNVGTNRKIALTHPTH
jgi:hypothetical protein